MSAAEDIAGIGHNLPDDPVEALKVELAGSHTDLIARRSKLLDGVGRVPEVIEDDETAAKVVDFTKQLKACKKDADSRRTAAKRPHLDASRAVDAFFKPVVDSMGKAAQQMEGRLTTYQRKKAEIEQKRREAEAKAKEEEARKAAEAAQTEADVDQAIEVEEAALAARATAEKTTATEAGRIRTDNGVVSSVRSFWDFEVSDYAAVKLEELRDYITPEMIDKAIRSAVKDGKRDVGGVRIFKNTRAQV